jgi:hypothetical protein
LKTQKEKRITCHTERSRSANSFSSLLAFLEQSRTPIKINLNFKIMSTFIDPSAKGANTNGQNKKTTSTVESGHAKNTANFDHLIALLLTYGTNYIPSTANLAITNLQTILTNAQGALTTVKNEYNGWKNATNSR